MPEAPTCTECGSPIPENAPEGCCPRCLFALASTRLSAGDNTVPDPYPAACELHGSIFGDYEILERIGEGGMGVVYKARQGKLGRTVALKMIRSGPLASEVEIQRFRSEAQAAASLQHANVVAIHEIGEQKGRLFFSMDYVEGESLAAAVRRNTLSAERAARYVKTVAEAVHYAHENGILHRDLKPANVLIDANDQPRITDFGLAKQLDVESGLTVSGEVMGTPSYAPPEQAEGRRGDMGPASDVYSLGAILYDLLVGRPPFRAETPVDTLRQVIDTEPVSPRLLNPKTPRDLETICLKCLAKKPRQRYGSARDLAEELERFLNNQPILARPISSVTRAWRWAQRKPARAGLTSLLLLVLLLLGAAAFLFQREALDGNMHSAEVAAGWIGGQLDTLRKEVEKTARDPKLLEKFEATGDNTELEKHLVDRHEEGNESGVTWMEEAPFHSLNLFDHAGNLLARSPPEVDTLQNCVDRDWFKGATKGRGKPYVSRVYHSRIGEPRDKFGISMRIDGVTRNPVVFMASVTTAPSGSLSGHQRNAVLIGRLDQSDESWLAEREWLIVAHHTFNRSSEAIEIVDLPKGIREGKTSGGTRFYLDPEYPFWKGPWLAGYAKIPDTEFYVIVQTRNWVARAFIVAGLLGIAGSAGYFTWRAMRRRAR